MNYNLSDKVILITGASKGIGKTISYNNIKYHFKYTEALQMSYFRGKSNDWAQLATRSDYVFSLRWEC